MHATDATNAARTMLYDIHRQVWDQDLLELFGVPAALLEQPDVKMTLNGPLLPDPVRACVGVGKTRAQVGGEDQGTLGICHRQGLDNKAFRAMWTRQFPGETAEAANDIIQFGRYRTTPSRRD